MYNPLNPLINTLLCKYRLCSLSLICRRCGCIRHKQILYETIILYVYVKCTYSRRVRIIHPIHIGRYSFVLIWFCFCVATKRHFICVYRGVYMCMPTEWKTTFSFPYHTNSCFTVHSQERRRTVQNSLCVFFYYYADLLNLSKIFSFSRKFFFCWIFFSFVYLIQYQFWTFYIVT